MFSRLASLFRPRPLELSCVLNERIAAQLDEAPRAEIKRQAADSLHEWQVSPFAWRNANSERLAWIELMGLPQTTAYVLLHRHARLCWPTAGQVDIKDRHGYVPGIYEVDPKVLRALRVLFEHRLDEKFGPIPSQSVNGIEHAEARAKQRDSERHLINRIHTCSPQAAELV